MYIYKLFYYCFIIGNYGTILSELGSCFLLAFRLNVLSLVWSNCDGQMDVDAWSQLYPSRSCRNAVICHAFLLGEASSWLIV